MFKITHFITFFFSLIPNYSRENRRAARVQRDAQQVQEQLRERLQLHAGAASAAQRDQGRGEAHGQELLEEHSHRRRRQTRARHPRRCRVHRCKGYFLYFFQNIVKCS